jgi:peptidoglycan/xylan/chitin deacetylase (PgdA/CDA1 family)
MKVSPEFLRNFLLNRKKIYDFISLDRLHDLSINGNKIKKPFIVMTFDDGYLDNYEYALPIFDELHIPFTVYVTNSFPDKTAILWWYILEDILKKNDSVILSIGKTFKCQTKEEKENVFLQLRDIILKFNPENSKEQFAELFYNYKFEYTSYNNKLCLSWDNIKEMANNDYCLIGAHTMNHKTLNLLSEKELEYEILAGKKKLEDEIKKPVKHFAYPFGTPNEIGIRETGCVMGYGFDTVCNAVGGYVNKKNIKNPLELPRVFLGELKR